MQLLTNALDSNIIIIRGRTCPKEEEIFRILPFSTMNLPSGFVDGEAYLEGLIESLATLPAEMRRNLDLMKDMDGSCSSLMEETMKLQQEYLQAVEGKLGRLEVVDGKGVRVLSSVDRERIENKDDDDESMEDSDSDLPVVIPTTEELLAYVNDGPSLSKIESLREDALQQAEEKVEIANQTLELMDNLCRKLDTDLKEMERSLLTRNGGTDFHSALNAPSLTIGRARGAPKKDDLAAVQEVPGSPDWILAKVMVHDPQTGTFKLSDEDIESKKIFNLPESQVIILERMRNLRIGDAVFAVYPDTTSFYQGTIAQPPRKAAGGGMFVMVTFVDDEDTATGKTLDKAVLLKHVMSPPY